MSLVTLDVAKARIADAHREAERRHHHRRRVIEQRQARQARRLGQGRRTPSRLIRRIATARPS